MSKKLSVEEHNAQLLYTWSTHKTSNNIKLWINDIDMSVVNVIDGLADKRAGF